MSFGLEVLESSTVSSVESDAPTMGPMLVEGPSL